MMSRMAPYLNLEFLGKAWIKSSCLLSTICAALALSGCCLMILTLLWQLDEIVDWTMTHSGHSRDLLGGGIRFVLTFEVHVLALLLMTPFWISFRHQASNIPVQGRWAIEVTGLPCWYCLSSSLCWEVICRTRFRSSQQQTSATNKHGVPVPRTPFI